MTPHSKIVGSSIHITQTPKNNIISVFVLTGYFKIFYTKQKLLISRYEYFVTYNVGFILANSLARILSFSENVAGLTVISCCLSCSIVADNSLFIST